MSCSWAAQSCSYLLIAAHELLMSYELSEVKRSVSRGQESSNKRSSYGLWAMSYDLLMSCWWVMSYELWAVSYGLWAARSYELWAVRVAHELLIVMGYELLIATSWVMSCSWAAHSGSWVMSCSCAPHELLIAMSYDIWAMTYELLIADELSEVKWSGVKMSDAHSYGLWAAHSYELWYMSSELLIAHKLWFVRGQVSRGQVVRCQDVRCS